MWCRFFCKARVCITRTIECQRPSKSDHLCWLHVKVAAFRVVGALTVWRPASISLLSAFLSKSSFLASSSSSLCSLTWSYANTLSHAALIRGSPGVDNSIYCTRQVYWSWSARSFDLWNTYKATMAFFCVMSFSYISLTHCSFLLPWLSSMSPIPMKLLDFWTLSRTASWLAFEMSML